MKTLKKVLAVVLALAMVLGMTAVSASAAFTGETIKYKEAVDVMNALGVLEGDANGKFNPTATLTREQAAKIICYMLLGKEAADNLPATAVFTDVPSSRWSAGAVAYCAAQGIVAGVGNGKFAPEDTVTGLQFAKMLLVALGYDATIEGMTGSNWSANVMKLVVATGLNEDMTKVALANALTREQAALMAFNAETTTMVAYDSAVNVTTGNTKVTVNAQRYSVANNSTSYYKNGNPTAGMQFCEQYAPLLKLDTTAATDDFDRPARTWFYDGTKVGAYVALDNEAVVTYTGSTKVATVADDLADYTVDATVYTNGSNGSAHDVTTTRAIANLTGNGVTVEVYDVNGDKTIDKVVVIYSVLAKVIKTNATDETITVTLDNATYARTLTTKLGYGTYAVGDYLMVTPVFTTEWKIAAVADVTKVSAAEATASVKASGVTTATIGGTDYKDAKMVATSSVAMASVVIGAKYDLIVDQNGFVVKCSGVTGTDKDYIYVYSVYETATKGVKSWYAVGADKNGAIVELKLTDSNEANEVATLSGTTYDKTNSNNGFENANDGKAVTSVININALCTYVTTSGTNNLTVVNTTTNKTGNVKLKSTTKSVASAGGTTYYFGENTTFITMTTTGGTEKLTAKKYAGVQATSQTNNTQVSFIADANNEIVLAFVPTGAESTVSNVLYFNDATADGSKLINGTTRSTYIGYIDGVKTYVPLKSAPISDSFYTYLVDEDGIYTITAFSQNVYGEEAVASIHNNDVTTASVMTAYDATNAVITDLTGNGITTVAEINNLIKVGATVNVAYRTNTVDETFTYIYVTDANYTYNSIAAGYVLISEDVADYVTSATVKFYDASESTTTTLDATAIARDSSKLKVSASNIIAPGTGDKITVTLTTIYGQDVTVYKEL